MTKSDKIKQLKSSLKNTKAQLKRREAKIARLEARNSQLEAEAKKKRKTNLWSKGILQNDTRTSVLGICRPNRYRNQMRNKCKPSRYC